MICVLYYGGKRTKLSTLDWLAKLAKMYLGIPATSASSKPVFSTAGNIVTSKRSCLLPENVNLLVFLLKNKHV
jgi:hypothetical protein